MIEQDPKLPSRKLADRLLEAQQRRFVGRQFEKKLFLDWLENPEPNYVLLHLWGPGGIGKTSLLHEFAFLARAKHYHSLQLDGRSLEPSPSGFLSAIKLALGLEEAAIFEAFAGSRTIIFIDAYELISPLDGWLREFFLPQLPDRSLVVLASRQALSEAWLADPGWQDLLKSIPLRNLLTEESRDYLMRRGVAEKHHLALLEFTHGHPLALSLVADVFAQLGGELSLRPETPGIVKVLLERFLQQIPSPKHREALEVSALVHQLHEALLAEALALEEVHEYFEWLRGLSFIELGPQGIFPQDIAREALEADLRWRNPDRHKVLLARIRAYYQTKLALSSGLEQQNLLFDSLYLHRHHPMIKDFFAWDSDSSVVIEAASPKDLQSLKAMLQRHEGEEALRYFEFWLERQPQSLTVCRQANAQPSGFLMLLNLRLASQEDIEADPASRASWNYALRYGPPRPQESILLLRFWLAQESYQRVSATQTRIFLTVLQAYLNTIHLAWSFFPCVDGDFWLRGLHYLDIKRVVEADFNSTKNFANFAHDWRAAGIRTWLERLSQPFQDPQTSDLTPPPPEPLLSLSETEFKRAAREALKDFSRVIQLGRNPLLTSRLIKAHAQRSQKTPVESLRALLKEGTALLAANPKEQKAYRAVLRTYLEPAASQELAAELLDLPFSTYRRHLAAGTGKIAEWLWGLELESLTPDHPLKDEL
ncbi:MAG: ATP-binding protein [Deinococcales bacterium]